MTARVGSPDSEFFESPAPGLLRAITGLRPEPSGIHVLLEPVGFRSTQRIALGDLGGGVVVGLWPAELKAQAEYLYRGGRGRALVAAARERGWEVAANPHLAFFSSPPSQRLYLVPDVSAEEYAARWEAADGARIGQYERSEVRHALWPWLKERGYASNDDDAALEQFIAIVGRRPVHLRPGLRAVRRWDSTGTELAGAVRRDVNAILGAAGEPSLPPA